jgi:hypothetical protein
MAYYWDGLQMWLVRPRFPRDVVGSQGVGPFDHSVAADHCSRDVDTVEWLHNIFFSSPPRVYSRISFRGGVVLSATSD